MKNNNFKLKKIVFLSALFVFPFLFLSAANAQTSSPAASQVFITWQAQDFTPADYQGKIIPSARTTVKLGLELLNQNKFQDLSKANIIWYLDGNFLTSGQGLKETSFTANKLAGDYHYIRTVINLGGQEYDGTVDIPTASPEIVIKTPAMANNSIPLGKNIFEAIPYFFNVSNLQNIIFNWMVNGQTAEGASLGGSTLELDLEAPVPANQILDIKVTAQNSKNELEFGSKEINLNVQK